MGGALAVVVIGVAAMSFTTGHGSAPVQSVGGPVASVAGGSAGASTSSRSKFGIVASRVMRANSIRAVPDRSLPPGMNAIRLGVAPPRAPARATRAAARQAPAAVRPARKARRTARPSSVLALAPRGSRARFRPVLQRSRSATKSG